MWDGALPNVLAANNIPMPWMPRRRMPRIAATQENRVNVGAGNNIYVQGINRSATGRWARRRLQRDPMEHPA